MTEAILWIAGVLVTILVAAVAGTHFVTLQRRAAWLARDRAEILDALKRIDEKLERKDTP